MSKTLADIGADAIEEASEIVLDSRDGRLAVGIELAVAG